jgi:NIPSNAP protein
VRTVQLRRYMVAAGQMERWLGEWRDRVRPLREGHGFEVVGAWVVEESSEFVWVIAYDGEGTFAEADAAYYGSPERAALEPDPARHLVEVRTDFVRELT